MKDRYIGKVIDNDDPDIEGKVQIYIEHLHHNITTNLYPWVRQDREWTSDIPEIGEFVWCHFTDEEYHKHGFYGNKVTLKEYHDFDATIGSMTGTYPDIKYIKLKNGVAFALNSEETEASLKVGSAEIYINSVGEITITSGKVIITGGELQVDGNASITGTGCFLGIKNCLFTGAPIAGNKISGT